MGILSKEEKGPNVKILGILNIVTSLLFSTSFIHYIYYYVISDFYENENMKNLKSDGIYDLIKTSFNTYLSIPPVYLLIWTGCFVYFFGFFGISFLISLQKEEEITNNYKTELPKLPKPPKTLPKDISILSDEEIISCIENGLLKDHQLERKLGKTNMERAVRIRRAYFSRKIIVSKNNQGMRARAISKSLPFEGYCYDKIHGANAEIVVGYMPLPVGLAGPLLLDGEEFYLPMATTEGCLIASTNRGCKAITSSGGANSVVLSDNISRAPCLRFPSAMRAAAFKNWIDEEIEVETDIIQNALREEFSEFNNNNNQRTYKKIKPNFEKIRDAFNSTTNYGRLREVTVHNAGRLVYLRFCCSTGDAMGMNMVSKGCDKSLELISKYFPDMELVAISGNMCTDKKPSAINWIKGRGKSIVVEAIIKGDIVKNTLKTDIQSMVNVNRDKNLVGSAMAGSIGGYNAHAANIVTALFIATGQDPAQNVESSNCITLLEPINNGKDLHISVTMPSIEVGTVGGGTSLDGQRSCLEILGVRGASRDSPGENARKLARIIGGAVMAGELSLLAALAANHLVKSHMEHNRKVEKKTVEEPIKSSKTLENGLKLRKTAQFRRSESVPAFGNMTSI